MLHPSCNVVPSSTRLSSFAVWKTHFVNQTLSITRPHAPEPCSISRHDRMGLRQVAWGFDSAMLRLFMYGSEFLTSLTVGLGARMCDADMAAVSKCCPHLQRLELRFATVSESGARGHPRAVAHRGRLLHCSAKTAAVSDIQSFLEQTSIGVLACGHVHGQLPDGSIESLTGEAASWTSWLLRFAQRLSPCNNPPR